MLVYGDLSRSVDVRQELFEIAEALATLQQQTPALGRHATLVGLLIRAGEVLQAVADDDFAMLRQDHLSSRQAGLTCLLLDLATAVWTSWRSGFMQIPEIDAKRWSAFAAQTQGSLTARIAEGFAFYAVYPEAYAAAAEAAGLPPQTSIVGLRSIGTTLAAMVAAATGSNRVVTLRPVGPPFQRELSLHPQLQASLAAPAPAHAVVDEGPGLSGSSFVAVIERLQGAGVCADTVALFPSHAGEPGAAASPQIRDQYRRTRRFTQDVDHLIVNASAPAHRLDKWLEPLTGKLTAPLRDLSGGAWRRARPGGAQHWPAVHPFQERRKFLAQAHGGDFLVKFVGLGREGERKHRLAQRLHNAGFSPRPVGLCHGFMVEIWHGDAAPLDLHRPEPQHLASHVGRYLAWRAIHCTAAPGRGASCARLYEMALQNIREGVSAQAAERFSAWRSEVEDLAREARPIESDNRMQAHEWLVARDGAILKTDAVDHHAAHDLIGCQDVAWDIAGASVELNLRGDAREHLIDRIASLTGRRPSARLLRFLEICYCAFELGAMTMARDAHADSDEARRADRVVGRRRNDLLDLLGFSATA